MNGCRYGPRCAYAVARSCSVRQELEQLPDDGTVRCIRAGEIGLIDPLADPLPDATQPARES
jgi:hypothetical protein